MSWSNDPSHNGQSKLLSCEFSDFQIWLMGLNQHPCRGGVMMGFWDQYQYQLEDSTSVFNKGPCRHTAAWCTASLWQYTDIWFKAWTSNARVILMINTCTLAEPVAQALNQPSFHSWPNFSTVDWSKSNGFLSLHWCLVPAGRTKMWLIKHCD